MTEENEPVVQPEVEDQLVLEETVEEPEDVVMTDVADEESVKEVSNDSVPDGVTGEAGVPVEEAAAEEVKVEEEKLVAVDSVEPVVNYGEEMPEAEEEPVQEEEEEQVTTTEDDDVPVEDAAAPTDEDVVPPLVEETLTPPEEEEMMVPPPVMEEKAAPGWEEPVKPNEDMIAMGVPTKETSGTTEEIEETSTMASGWTQVRALCEKNMLTKLRTPGATAAEFFSPVLLILVLWFAYNMSDVVFKDRAYFHYMNVDLPFFWDTGYGEDETEGFDPADSHRRNLKMTMDTNGEQGEGFQRVDYGLEEGKEEATHWNWARLLGEGLDSHELGEDMGLINDLFMMNHARKLTREDFADDLDMFTGQGFADEGIEKEEDQDEADSGDWYEEIWADIKAETVDKIDWDEVEQEVKDNFGELWDDAKDYIFVSSYKSTHWRLNQMRLRVSSDLATG